MKTVLSDLDVIIKSGYMSIDSISYDAKSHRCTILVSDNQNCYQIVFDDTIAFRMMDEREMYEFWPINIEMASSIEGAALHKIESGGWQGTDEHIRNAINDGYFNRTESSVAEYVICTGYECINMIALYPEVSITGPSSQANDV